MKRQCRDEGQEIRRRIGMRFVTETGSLTEAFSDEDSVRILAKAGFDAMDWSFFSMLSGKTVWCGDSWKEHAARVRETATE